MDAEGLRFAAQLLVERHACLRTAFILVNDPPMQLVVKKVQVPWSEVDLSGRPITDRSHEFDRLMEDDRIARFDLQNPPLLRFLLVKTGERQHRLVLTVHHCLLDGWSMPLMLSDFFSLYASGGDASALPEVRPFRDHLTLLSTRDRTAASAAWAQMLQGITGPTLLAVARQNRPPKFPEQLDAGISEDLASRLVSLARVQGLTLNTLVQAAWAVVLSRSVGQLDVVFGAVVSGRSAELPGVESMLGLFINTVPVRVRLDPAESLVALLHRIQVEQSQLLNHQYVGLAELQRDAGVGVLFDTLLTFESYPLDIDRVAQVLDDSGVALTGMEWYNSTHYPMNLVVVPGARMQIILKYQPDCFDSFSVRILADRLVRVLAAMTANPEARIGTIDVLSVLERHQLLVEWNRGSEIEGSVGNHADVFNRTSAELICARLIRVLHAMVDNPDARLTDVDVLAADEWRRLVVKWNDSATDVPDTTLLKLLEQQVVRSPDSTAVVFGDKCLTYAELDARASSIGRFFASENIGPEQIVGVHANRSLELIVALVGVLKSGAAFVLLEPTWPHQRVSEVCSRSGLITVLAGDPDAFPDIQGVSVLSIVDTEESTAAKTACATDVQRSARPEGLAYVVFTSGSTGVPKGAMIRHGAIAACHA